MTSRVEERHPQFENMEYQWRQMRDTDGGPTYVKRSGELYLPIPSAMLSTDNSASFTNDHGRWNNNDSNRDLWARAPWNHSNPAYSAYIQRARFPDIVSVCKRGFVGVATKEAPIIKLPSQISYLEDRCTKNGLNLIDLYKRTVAELLLMGRYEILVDIIPDRETGRDQIGFVTYCAESMINWKVTNFEGDIEPYLVVFEENVEGKNQDEFSHAETEGQRVLRIDPETKEYTSELFINGKSEGPPKTPSHKGQTMPAIPLVVANSNGLGMNIGPSPLIGVSDVAISIYQKDADMSQAEFMTCNPMLVITGADEDTLPKAIGSTVAWAIDNDQAKAYFVEPKATSLNHMRQRITDLFSEAVQYGSAILGQDKNSAEAEATVRMRQEANGATLKDVCYIAKEAITKALKLAAVWVGADPNGIEFDPPMDFAETKLTAQEQTALLQSWMNGAISHETYLENLQEADILSEEVTVEQEIDRIATQRANLDLTGGATPPGNNSDGEGEDDEDEDEGEGEA